MRKAYLKLACLLFSLLALDACKTTAPQPSESIKPPRAFAYNPKAATYNIQLGLAYLKEGDIPRAKRKLLTALVQNPSSAETHDAMAYFLEQTGDPQNAQKYYLKAIALGPQQGAPLNNYGAFLCRQGQYQQAEDYFLRAIADPNYINTASAYENAGLCATLIPNWKKAAFYLEKALAKEPNRLGALYELSRIKERQHDTLQAQRYLARYLTLTREHPHKAALQLAYKLAHQLHQKQKARHYARLLKQHFPQDPITPMRG